jgi:hypothetical protein
MAFCVPSGCYSTLGVHIKLHNTHQQYTCSRSDSTLCTVDRTLVVILACPTVVQAPPHHHKAARQTRQLRTREPITWTRWLNAKEPTCERSKRSIRSQRAKCMHGSTLKYAANAQRLQVQVSLIDSLLPNWPRNDTRWPTTSRHGSHLPSAMLNTTFLRAPEAHPQGGERKEPQLEQYLQHWRELSGEMTSVQSKKRSKRRHFRDRLTWIIELIFGKNVSPFFTQSFPWNFWMISENLKNK